MKAPAPRAASGPLLISCALLLGGAGAFGPAAAQDKPTLKDVLGRVQTEGDTKAVEDLVDKLKGVTRKPAPDAAAAPGSAASPPPTDPPMLPPQSEGGAPTRPPAGSAPKTASPQRPAPEQPKPPASKPPPLKPDEAVRRAETADAPSVDLEVFFEYNSAQITPKSTAVLNTLGRALADARLAEDAFLIAGHTDAKGAADYNLALSQRRAEAVRQYLIANFRIAASKLVAKGYAAKHPKNAGDPLAAENRRVQIVNLSKDKR